MQLRYITCSGANENTPIEKIVDLSKQSKLVEIGIAANSSTMKKGKNQYDWFDQLLNTNEVPEMNLSVHIGGDWCTDFCNGKIAPEIQRWMSVKNKKTNTPLIPRWQLNISNYMNLSKTEAIRNIINANPDKEFVFSFNRGPIIMNFINDLYKYGTKFSLLFDSSYGSGRHPKRWEEPCFAGRACGYSGGLSGENVYDSLTSISYVVPNIYTTWIDAEYNLKTPGTNDFDVERAKQYVLNALMWEKKHTR